MISQDHRAGAICWNSRFSARACQIQSNQCNAYDHICDYIAGSRHRCGGRTLLSVVFVAVIVLAIVRTVYAKQLHTRVLDWAWQAIFNHVDK